MRREWYPEPAPISATTMPGLSFSSASNRSGRSSCKRSGRSSQAAACQPITPAISRAMYDLPIPSAPGLVRRYALASACAVPDDASTSASTQATTAVFDNMLMKPPAAAGWRRKNRFIGHLNFRQQRVLQHMRQQNHPWRGRDHVVQPMVPGIPDLQQRAGVHHRHIPFRIEHRAQLALRLLVRHGCIQLFPPFCGAGDQQIEFSNRKF